MAKLSAMLLDLLNDLIPAELMYLGVRVRPRAILEDLLRENEAVVRIVLKRKRDVLQKILEECV